MSRESRVAVSAEAATSAAASFTTIQIQTAGSPVESFPRSKSKLAIPFGNRTFFSADRIDRTSLLSVYDFLFAMASPARLSHVTFYGPAHDRPRRERRRRLDRPGCWSIGGCSRGQ